MESAVLDATTERQVCFALDADHSNMCKFDAADSRAYRNVWKSIRIMVNQALQARVQLEQLAQLNTPAAQAPDSVRESALS